MPQDIFANEIVNPFPFAATIPGLFAANGFVVIPGRSIGYVAAATLNTPTNVRATLYTQQSSAAQRSIVSSSVSDTSAGIGAQTVTINYLNNSMSGLLSTTITLNGTTAVNTTATDIQFIESIVVTTCGSSLANVGTISLFSGIAGTGSAFASIVIGDNSTFYAHHYVPTGFNCYVMKHTGSGTLSSGRTYMVQMGDPRTVSPILQVGDIISHLAGGSEDHDYDVPLVVPGPNLIVARENPNASTSGNFAYASFDWMMF